MFIGSKSEEGNVCNYTTQKVLNSQDNGTIDVIHINERILHLLLSNVVIIMMFNISIA